MTHRLGGSDVPLGPSAGGRQVGTRCGAGTTGLQARPLSPICACLAGQLAAGTCEIVTLDRDSSQPRRTIARQTARCACRKGQIAGTTRARPACVDGKSPGPGGRRGPQEAACPGSTRCPQPPGHSTEAPCSLGEASGCTGPPPPAVPVVHLRAACWPWAWRAGWRGAGCPRGQRAFLGQSGLLRAERVEAVPPARWL